MAIPREKFSMLFQIANDASGSEVIRDLVYRYYLYQLDDETEKADAGLSPHDFLTELNRILEIRKSLVIDDLSQFYLNQKKPPGSLL